ncbi:MAG: SIMPL domain-containing protein [Cyclobacteriaceae bacterium]
MKRIQILPLIFILSLSFSIAQTKSIEIGGYGEMKVAPDQGILSINIRSHRMTFSNAVKALSKKENKILETIEALGYDKEDVRTSNFSVRENIIWRNGTRYDSGYIASQYMALEFPNSKERIAKILNEFSSEKTEAEINFSFKLSDSKREELNAQVIELAVNDAKTNAKLLAKFSGATIKGVLKIKYHVAQQSSYPTHNRMEMMAFDSSANLKSSGGSNGFQADDITLSDSVTIFYEIE